MFPAIERRSGRSRYTSATRSSSITATRCSPMSTEISSSRLAAGSGARRGGWRRRWVPPLWPVPAPVGRPLGPLAALGLLPRGLLRGLLRHGRWRSRGAVAAGRFRPRPPRLPRRRLLLARLGVGAGRGRFCGRALLLDLRLSRGGRNLCVLRRRARPARPSSSSIGTRASSASPRCSARGHTASHRDAGLAQRMSKTMAIFSWASRAGYQCAGRGGRGAGNRRLRRPPGGAAPDGREPHAGAG